ncbi:hypothetical protein ACWEQG_21315 [Microbispora sp. NPDC004025]
MEKDYCCGDPVSDLRPGERVLDPGSGAGKVCFIAAQTVGSAGSVLRVDIDDGMSPVTTPAALYRGPFAAVAHGTGLQLVGGRLVPLRRQDVRRPRRQLRLLTLWKTAPDAPVSALLFGLMPADV